MDYQSQSASFHGIEQIPSVVYPIIQLYLSASGYLRLMNCGQCLFSEIKYAHFYFLLHHHEKTYQKVIQKVKYPLRLL
jgi:hypothetical protein